MSGYYQALTLSPGYTAFVISYHNRVNSKLTKELKKAVAEKLFILGKNASWLQFAKKTKYGYRMLAHKEAQWKILEGIAKDVHVRFPELHRGQVVDALCELVNSR